MDIGAGLGDGRGVEGVRERRDRAGSCDRLELGLGLFGDGRDGRRSRVEAV